MVLVLQVNSKNFYHIRTGKKTIDYRNIVSVYTEMFEQFFNFTYRNGFIIQNNAIVDCTKPKWIKFRHGYFSHWRSRHHKEIDALVSISIDHGKQQYGGNPDIVYYVLTIHEIKET